MATKSQTLSIAQAATLFGRSERWVHTLREKGYVSTDAPGVYPLVGTIRGALAYMEDLVTRQDQTARETAVTDARTREIELRIERKAADLILTHDVVEMLDEMIEVITAEFRQLPTRATRNLARRRAIREEVNIILARLKITRDRLVAELQEG